jgi:hypothetical protein
MAIVSLNQLMCLLGAKKKSSVRGRLAQRNRKKVISGLCHEQLEPRLLMTTAPAGDQFAVAAVSGFEGTPASIAVNNSGDYVVAWESFEEDGSGFGVFAQRFGVNGVAAAPKFQVNTTVDGEQSAPAVAVDGAGNFLVVWQSQGQDNADKSFGVFGRWYDSAGNSLGSEFLINSTASGDQKAPSVAIDGSGRAIVTWQSDGQDGDKQGVYYTVLDAVGDTSGVEVRVNDVTLGNQQKPAVAVSSDGKYVIAWEAIDPAGGSDASLDIFAKLYASNGQSLGSEFRVNTDTLRDQVGAQVAMDADGDIAVIWVAGGIPGSGSDIFGQRFSSTGVKQGSQFRANNTTLASQVYGGVAMDGTGSYMVTWQSVNQDGFAEGIFGRAYAANGTTLVDEFVVNTTVEGPQSVPSIAMNAGGKTVVVWRGKNEEHESALFAQRYLVPNSTLANLKVGGELQVATFEELESNAPSAAMDLTGSSIVVWESYGQDGDGMGVYAQRLDQYGDPVGAAFLVNATATASNQSAPTVAKAPDGRFVIAWQSKDQDGSGYGIYAQMYDSQGVPVNSAFLVNTTTLGNQTSPVVAMGEDGRFVIAWVGDSGDGTTDIYAKRYSATGQVVATEFRVNNFTATNQNMPTISMNAVGQFGVAWVSSHPSVTEAETDAEKSVFVQWYDSDGNSTGNEALVHKYVKDAQESPKIGLDAAGNFVVAWQSINQDGSTWGVYARQFLASKTPIQPAEFLVNETTAQLQRLVGVGVQADGRFVVAWENTAQSTDDGSSTEIYRREFLADGTPDGHENVVNTWTGGPQTLPVVARAATGNYGIFWMGQGFSHIDGVHGRLYDVNLSSDPGKPSRLPLGDQFLVGATLGFETSAPAIAVNNDGSFTVAFESFEEDGSGFGIFAERFNADGSPIANSRVQVNTTILDDQSSPALATDGAGNILIVWQSKDTNGFGIFGQWFNATGTKNGSEFRVNSTVVGDQTKPDVALDPLGRAVVVWQSSGQDGNGLGVYYNRYDTIGDVTSVEKIATNSTAGDQQAPSVAVASGTGEFTIVWQGPGAIVEGEASIEVFARRFSNVGLPLANEVTVNAVVEKDQVLPDVAMDQDGDTIVVWQVEGQQGSGSDIYARRLSGSGVPQGTDFRVNSTVSRPQRSPAVAMDAAGNSLVTWQSQYQDGYSWGIYGQVYNASGAIVQSEFEINERVEGPQTIPNVHINNSGATLVTWVGNSATHQPTVFGHRYLVPNTEPDLSVGEELALSTFVGLEDTPPAAAMNEKREAVVAWTSYAEDGSGLGIFAQMLDSQGRPIGARIAVNKVTAGNQSSPSVARSPSGAFVVVWESEAEDGSGYGIYAQLYAPDGTPRGSVFRVNSTTAGDQLKPAVAMGYDGSFIIAWQGQNTTSSSGNELNYADVMAQRYSAAGLPIGGEFRVNSQVGLDQRDPTIAINSNGEFAIAWVSDHPALTDPVDTEKSIFFQWYNAQGTAVGNEVLVHRFVKDAQEAPALGIDKSGRVVVAYQSINQDGNSWGVFARRFNRDKTPIDRSEFVVNESRMGPQRYVGVGVDETGRFVVTWQSNSHEQEGASWDVYSRQYAFDGKPEGGEISVNQWTNGPQTNPVVAQAPSGDFGIFWQGQGPDHVEGVNGRLYDLPVSKFAIAFNPGTGQWQGSTMTASGNGVTKILAQWATSAAAGWQTGITGDFNGDGVTDIAAREASGKWWIGLANEGSYVTSSWGFFASTSTWATIKVGDVNNDGKDDVIGFVPKTGVWTVGVSDGSKFQNYTLANWSTQVTWVDLLVADFTGDGRDDVAGRTTTGQWWMAESNSVVGALARNDYLTNWSTAVTWKDVKALDYNGDGLLDIVGRATRTGSDYGDWWIAQTKKESATNYSSDNSYLVSWNERAGWTVYVGDMDGDGRDDIFGRSSDGQWWVTKRQNSTNTTLRLGTWPNTTYRATLIGDVDGDGRDDLIGRNSVGKWLVSRFPTGPGSQIDNSPATWQASVDWLFTGLGEDDGSLFS